MSPIFQRSVRESNPVCRLTKAVCFRNTYRPNLSVHFIQCPRWESNPQNHQALDLAAFPFAYSDAPAWAGEKVDGRKQRVGKKQLRSFFSTFPDLISLRHSRIASGRS
jgi:hypothetical protein